MDYGYKPTTNGRKVLIACMDSGGSLQLTRVAFGKGRVAESAELADQHTLVDYVADGTIGDRRHENDRLYLTVQYTNKDHRDIPTFYLTEFIVYARDPDTGKETDLLYATLGDYAQPVPAFDADFPASVFNFPLVLVLSDEINVSISAPAGLVTYDELEEHMRRAGFSNPNLLDNWYFPAPINQRGQNEYEGLGYSIDRWKSADGTTQTHVKIESDGITVSSNTLSAGKWCLLQTIEADRLLKGRTYTLSILIAEISGSIRLTAYGNGVVVTGININSPGLHSVTFTTPSELSGTVQAIIATGGVDGFSAKLLAAKLELGSVQTLAHKEGDEWVLNDPPPNKAVELAKCQRYQLVLPYGVGSLQILGIGIAITATTCTVMIPIPVSMRDYPTIRTEGDFKLYGHNGTLVNSPVVASITNRWHSNSQNAIYAWAESEGLTPEEMYLLMPSDSGERLILDANL